MESLKNEFENFLQEMVENNLNTLKKQNVEYTNCKDNEKNITKTMDELIDKLSDHVSTNAYKIWFTKKSITILKNIHLKSPSGLFF